MLYTGVRRAPASCASGRRNTEPLIRSPVPVREPRKGEFVLGGRSCRRRPQRFLGRVWLPPRRESPSHRFNLEESDAFVGIVFLQMPTTRGRIIRLDADVFAARPAADRACQGRPRSDDPVGGPTGFEFADAIPVVKRLPIKGADGWRALVESRTA